MLDDIVRPEMEQFRKGNGFFLAMPGRNFSNQDLRDSLSQLRIQSDLLRDSAYTETLRGDLPYTPKQRFIYLAQEIRIVLLEHRKLNREDSEWEHEFLVAHIESKPGEYGLLVLDRCRGNDFRTVSGQLTSMAGVPAGDRIRLFHSQWKPPGQLVCSLSFPEPFGLLDLCASATAVSQVWPEYDIAHTCYWYSAALLFFLQDEFKGSFAEGEALSKRGRYRNYPAPSSSVYVNLKEGVTSDLEPASVAMSESNPTVGGIAFLPAARYRLSRRGEERKKAWRNAYVQHHRALWASMAKACLASDEGGAIVEQSRLASSGLELRNIEYSSSSYAAQQTDTRVGGLPAYSSSSSYPYDSMSQQQRQYVGHSEPSAYPQLRNHMPQQQRQYDGRWEPPANPRPRNPGLDLNYGDGGIPPPMQATSQVPSSSRLPRVGEYANSRSPGSSNMSGYPPYSP